MTNIPRTGALMTGWTGVFLVAGFLVGGETGMLIALPCAAGSIFFAYRNADRMLLAMHRAREVDGRTAPSLVRLVRRLSRGAGMPMPRVCVADNDRPNAFATGRSPKHATVCVTSGLLRRLNREELAGVLAHELSHVRNGDTRATTLTATIAGAVSMLDNLAVSGDRGRNGNPLALMGTAVTALLAAIAAMLVRIAVDPAAEFEADRGAAEMSGRPLWLASALQRIESHAAAIGNAAAGGHCAAARMAVLDKRHAASPASFGRHPSMGERIARLHAMAIAMGQTPGPEPWA